MISVTAHAWLLEAANIFFFVFHVCLILFNLFGWIPRRTRKWNLVALGLTAFSWLGLGYFYGWGYCFLTDWHWEVRQALGYPTEASSYIRFLVLRLTPFDVDPGTVNTWTAILFGLAVGISLYMNLFRKKRPREDKNLPG